MSSLAFGALGLLLTFASDVVLSSVGLPADKVTILIGQVLGALYFGFSMLNWMSRGNLIGGIYARPTVIANFAHLLIAGLALLKAVISNLDLPMSIWIVSIIYLVFGVCFAVVLFRHPIPPPNEPAG